MDWTSATRPAASRTTVMNRLARRAWKRVTPLGAALLFLPVATAAPHPRQSAPQVPGPAIQVTTRSQRTLAKGPLHGYAIARKIKQLSAEGLSIEDGSLYPALNRMLVKGWLTAEWGVSENNRRARFYSLTRKGRKQLQREASEFDQLIQAIQLVMRSA